MPSRWSSVLRPHRSQSMTPSANDGAGNTMATTSSSNNNKANDKKIVTTGTADTMENVENVVPRVANNDNHKGGSTNHDDKDKDDDQTQDATAALLSDTTTTTSRRNHNHRHHKKKHNNKNHDKQPPQQERDNINKTPRAVVGKNSKIDHQSNTTKGGGVVATTTTAVPFEGATCPAPTRGGPATSSPGSILERLGLLSTTPSSWNGMPQVLGDGRPHAQDRSHALEASLSSSSGFPVVTTSCGHQVTIVDANLKIFVVHNLVGHDTCDSILAFAQEHVRRVEERGDFGKSWRTLYTYTKMDLPTSEVPGLSLIMRRLLLDVARVVGEMLDKPFEASFLRPRSWKEPHLLNYQKVEGKEPHLGIPMHYDGCDYTFQLALSRRDEYSGGGTYFRSLRKTIMLSKGQVLLHPGELYHKGCDITHGLRRLVVCFMDGFNPCVVDESLESEDDVRFESNIVEF